MATTWKDRLRCVVASAPGTGDITVGAASSAAMQGFGASDDGKTFEVTISEGNSWEVVRCTYTHSAARLNRSTGTLLSSSTGSAISFGAGAVVTVATHAAWMAELEATAAQAVQLTDISTPTADMLSIANRLKVFVSPEGARMRSNATASAAGTGLLPEHRPLCEKATIAIFGNSVVSAGGAPQNLMSGNTWQASTAIALSAVCNPQWWDFRYGLAPIKWVCTTAGTTGTTEPVWNHAAAVGTTVTDGSVVWTATAFQWHRWTFGWWVLAQALSGQRLVEQVICGCSGKQSPDILAYVDRVIDDPTVGVVFFSALWENDVSGSPSASLPTITSRWASFVAKADACRAAGKKLIVQTLLPSGHIDSSSVFSGYVAGDRTKVWHWLNDKIREYAKNRPDVILWDAALLYIDTNPANPVWPENTVTYLSASGTGQQLKKTDGVHPQLAASWILGKSLAAVLAANFPLREIVPTHGNPYNAVANPLMYGTAGNRGLNIGSGTVPTGHSMDAYGGTSGSCVSSSVARTDIVGSWARLVFVAAAGDNASFNWDAMAPVPFAVGDVVQAFAEFRITANPTQMTAPYIMARLGGLADQWLYSNAPLGTDQDLGQFITAETSFLIKTIPIAFPPGVTGLSIYNKVAVRGTSSMTVDFGRAGWIRRDQPTSVS